MTESNEKSNSNHPGLTTSQGDPTTGKKVTITVEDEVSGAVHSMSLRCVDTQVDIPFDEYIDLFSRARIHKPAPIHALGFLMIDPIPEADGVIYRVTTNGHT